MCKGEGAGYKGEETGCTGVKSTSNLHPAGSSTQDEKTAELAEMQCFG